MLTAADLLALPLFEGATAAEVAALLGATSTVAVRAGEVVVRQGDPGGTFLLVVDAVAEVRRADGPDDRLLAVAGPGAVLGELTMLTGRPRVASVVVRDAGRLLVGGPDAFEVLLSLPTVHERVTMLTARRVAEVVAPVQVELADGSAYLVRPLRRTDREVLDRAIADQSAETLRRRFFTPGHPGPRVVDHLVEINYLDHFAWGVTTTDGTTGVAAARYVRLHDDPTTADISVGIDDHHQGHGLGTYLVGALAVVAADAGIARFTADVLAENAPMRHVLDRAGAAWTTPSAGVATANLDVDRARTLVDEPAAGALRRAAHDVVTAAGLALAGPAR